MARKSSKPATQKSHSVKNAQQANLLIIKQVRRFGQVNELTQIMGGGNSQLKGLSGGNILKQIQSVQGFEENTVMIFQQSFQGEEVHQIMSSIGTDLKKLLGP